jgi:hypothetical protein
VKPDYPDIRSGLCHWRYAGFESLRLIHTDVGEVPGPQKTECPVEVIFIQPGVMAKFYRYPVLGQPGLAGDNIIPLFVSRVKPGRKLKQDDPQFSGAVQGQKGLIEAFPHLVQ